MFNINEPIISGLIIGFLPAVIGGFITYQGFLKRSLADNSGALVLMTLTSAMLMIIGIVAVISGLFNGELGKMLLTGVGVLFGFTAGFGVMLALYIRMDQSGKSTRAL